MSNKLSFEENGVLYDLHLNDQETSELSRHLRARNELVHQETLLKRRRIVLEDRLRNLGYRFSDDQGVVEPSFRANAYDADDKQIRLGDLVRFLTTGAETTKDGHVIMIKDDWITVEDKNGNKVRRKSGNVLITETNNSVGGRNPKSLPTEE